MLEKLIKTRDHLYSVYENFQIQYFIYLHCSPSLTFRFGSETIN